MGVSDFVIGGAEVISDVRDSVPTSLVVINVVFLVDEA